MVMPYNTGNLVRIFGDGSVQSVNSGCIMKQQKSKKEKIEKNYKLFSNYGAHPNMEHVVWVIQRSSKALATLKKDVKTILSINCGDAVCEQYVIDRLFPHIENENVIHTDIIIPSDNKNGVIKESAATALKNHVTDLVLCFFPAHHSEGYSDIIIKYFKAKYLIFLGEFKAGGHCDPGELIPQIYEEMEMDILLDKQVSYCSTKDITDNVVIFKMKENEEEEEEEEEEEVVV